MYETHHKIMQECEDYIERIREEMHLLAEWCGRRGGGCLENTKRCRKLIRVFTDYRGKLRSVESDTGKNYGPYRKAGSLNERTYGINMSVFLKVP
jgi:hypothetical protein